MPSRQIASPAPVALVRDRALAHGGGFDLAGAAQVLRHAILDRVERSAAPLVLLRAPAGFGKTTALRQVRARLQARGVATAWLTLDADDDDGPRFSRLLADTCAGLQIAGSPDSSGERERHVCASEALEQIEREGTPFALFLDEFELLQSPAALALLRAILSRWPRNGRLLIGARSLPDAGPGLSRWRVRGQLLEIDAEALRFGLAETRDLLQARGLPALAHDALALLHAGSEGWAAALVLAAMALERKADPAALLQGRSGADALIAADLAEYLADEVLGRQPPELRQFLLRSSILRQLSPSLCQALQPRSDCARMLARAQATSLFLLPQEAQAAEPQYRFHRLFAAFLRERLARELPHEVLRLHRAASGCYEALARPVPAIEHAIAGGDLPHALALLARCAQGLLEAGRMRLLARWFALMGRAILRAQPRLQAIAVWATLFTQGPDEALALLADSGIADSADPLIGAHLNALRPLLLAMQDRYPEADAAARAAMARLPTALPFADALLTHCMAHLSAVLGQEREAQRLLDAARGAQYGSPFNRMYAESTEGLLDFERGLLRQALARFRSALGESRADTTTGATGERRSAGAGGNVWAAMLYAGAMYEANALELVEELLALHLPLVRALGLPDPMIAGHAMRSRMLLARGDADGAARVLTELEALGHLRRLPRVLAAARLERACLLMRQGDALGARAELERSDDPAVWQTLARQRLPAPALLDIGLGRLRWELHFGDAVTAARRIGAELPAALAQSRIRRAHQLRVLWALALWRQNRAQAAAKVLHEVLLAGSREGFARLLLDEGPALAGPLHAVWQRLRQAPRAGEAMLLGYVQRLLAALEDEAQAGAPGPMAKTGALWSGEPLTSKETRVLTLLAEGHSNGALAEQLFVAESTVRTHLRSINSKLAAHNRTQAVSIARRPGLIG